MISAGVHCLSLVEITETRWMLVPAPCLLITGGGCNSKRNYQIHQLSVVAATDSPYLQMPYKHGVLVQSLVAIECKREYRCGSEGCWVSRSTS